MSNFKLLDNKVFSSTIGKIPYQKNIKLISIILAIFSSIVLAISSLHKIYIDYNKALQESASKERILMHNLINNFNTN